MVFSRRNARVLAVIAWIGVIFFSSTSLASQWCEQGFSWLSSLLFGHLGPTDPSYGILHLLADKGVHVSLFLILAMLLCMTIPQIRWKAAIVLGCGALVGSCSEFLQRFFPGRDPAIRDVLINIGGTAAGLALHFAIVHFRDDRTSGGVLPRATEAETVSTSKH